MKKKCIFHIPNHVNPKAISGSNVRPMKMLQAFQNIGYDVEVIMGYGKERKEQIKKIKQNIKKGVKYDFLYSESSIMPTLLTEKNHFPLYPNLDFGFFKFCKKNGIKIGLFYRDIQWKFKMYRDCVPIYKRCFSIPMYRYDLYRYKKLLHKFYLTSLGVENHLKEYPKLIEKMDILPPGCDEVVLNKKNKDIVKTDAKIHIFYVGGICQIYNLEMFLEGVQSIPEIEMIICCRETEWKKEKERYKKYLTPQIKIVHASGEELKAYYQWADICCAFAGKGDYMSMAMPIKVFEYLGYGKPIIGTKGTESGKFIEENGIGWNIGYDLQELKKSMLDIVKNPEIICYKQKNIEHIREQHFWTSRATKVSVDLS